MSDIEVKTPATAATNLDVSEDGILREKTPDSRITPPPAAGSTDLASVPGVVATAIDDSEAETLIESPEKRKVALMLDTAPEVKKETVEAPETSIDKSIEQEPESPSSDSKSRKRKRAEVAGSRYPRAPSASSVLSSPSLDELAGDHGDDVLPKIRSSIQLPDYERVERREGSREREWKRKNKFDSQIKVQKRRPSDVLTEDHKTRPTKPRQHSDVPDHREIRSATYPRHSSSERSPSPRQTARGHKRVQSIQSVGAASGSHRSKRNVPPLLTGRQRQQSEDRQSVSTDRSGSPTQNSFPNLRRFTTTDHDAISPAKQPMSSTFGRRHRDQNGRTRLAKACADNKLEVAKTKYDERSEDLNIPDNAGNTPLQIASLEGYVDIVEFLLSKNCDVDTKNIDKETPLIDAVENGHLEVVQLLLDNGANPRLGNAKGDEPYELVPLDDENYGAIRALLADARSKYKESDRRPSDDYGQGSAARSSSRPTSVTSPRDSPPIHTPRSPPSYIYSRRRTGRSEQTRNDLLWQAQTPENLQKLAAKGDSEGVASILNVLEKVHPAAVIAAARGGHHQTLEMLIALGQPDPDPPPVRNNDFKPGYNTPMLAAIGRGNLEVIKLLLGQTGFNPRRPDIKGRTYPEISKERKGDRWEEEYRLLKEAYDRAKNPDMRKHESPRKLKDRDKEHRRPDRRSPSPVRMARKVPRSPSAAKDIEARRSEARRESKRDRGSDDHRPVKPRAREHSPTRTKTHRTRRSQSDLPTILPESEVKRRRLVSGKILHERRSSMASHKSSSDNDAADASAHARRELKKERSLLKRSRDSMTPERRPSTESELLRDAQKKRRRVLSDSSPEAPRREPVRQKAVTSIKRESTVPQVDPAAAETAIDDATDSINVLGEGLPSAPSADEVGSDERQSKGTVEQESRATAEDTGSDEVARKAKEEAQRQEEIQRQAEAQREAEAERQKEAERQEAEARALAEKRAAEAAEAAEAARRKAEEEAFAAEERRKAEEIAAEQRRLEEEAAAKQREEEERAERAHKEEENRLERQRREEERQRRVEERRRREAEEQERIRREALPPLLCKTAEMLDLGDGLVKDQSWLQQYLPLYTVYTRQLDPGCANDVAEEEWIPNFQAAGLFTVKDLHLRQYTQLEKRSVNPRERLHLWKVAGVKLSKEFRSNAFNTKFEQAVSAYDEAGAKFSTMEPLFWVRLADFRNLIPIHPHLKALPIKTQRIRVHPVTLPLPERSYAQPNGILSSTTPIVNGVLANGVNHTNGYHHA